MGGAKSAKLGRRAIIFCRQLTIAQLSSPPKKKTEMSTPCTQVLKRVNQPAGNTLSSTPWSATIPKNTKIQESPEEAMWASALVATGTFAKVCAVYWCGGC